MNHPAIAPLLLLATFVSNLSAAQFPLPDEGDHVLHDFRFRDGKVLPDLKIHFRTWGKPARNANGQVTNAVLILHGTTGNGGNFVRNEFAGELFGPGQILDASLFYLIAPDNVGHGKSSKPSDGLHGRFPNYGYQDMIDIQHRLLTAGLHVDHLRLVMGTSMGGMHSWLWGEMYPTFMDALMPLASLPGEISGRNRIWRRVVIDAIRGDPEWNGGDYKKQPPSLRTAAEMLLVMGSNPIQRQKEAPTLEKADAWLESNLLTSMKNLDANDVLYAFEASHDYNPAPVLEKIQAPLVAINFEDDLINPPELQILEREIKRVPHGKAIVVPRSDKTRGHGTHTLAAIWKNHLADLLNNSKR